MTSSHVADATRYARQVVAGKIVACKWVRLACARQLADLKWSKENPVWPYFFDKAAADRICNFIEMVPHVKGDLAKKRQTIKLEPWQKFGLTTVFGWLNRQTGHRRFRTVYEEVARKNAKSTKLSAIGLYMLALDGEEGAECYSAATKREQARIVFRAAQAMARKLPKFRDRFGVEVLANNISVASTNSKFEALDAEGTTLDGLNIHFAAIDELHAHKTRGLFDVLETGTGSRLQSLLWNITTAGSNRAGICYELRTYLTKVLEGVYKDDTFFGIIYTIDEGDDYTDPKVWPKANPNLGVSAFIDDIARLCAKAQQMASARNNFLTKRLNVWCNADTAWMDMAAWAACADPSLDMADFAGEGCVMSMDLASKIDIASTGTLFTRQVDGKDHYYWFARHYLPAAAVQSGVNSQYEGWEQDGRLTATEGNVTDYDVIEEDILWTADLYYVKEMAFDPHQATQIVTHLMNADLECVEMRPTVLNFSEPMKELEALVLQGRFHHTGCPVMTWMISNVVCHLDAKDNIYPRKERVENKIDGVVAAIMALGRAMAPDEDDLGSELAEALKRRGMVSIQ